MGVFPPLAAPVPALLVQLSANLSHAHPQGLKGLSVADRFLLFQVGDQPLVIVSVEPVAKPAPVSTPHAFDVADLAFRLRRAGGFRDHCAMRFQCADALFQCADALLQEHDCPEKAYASHIIGQAKLFR